jgi:hypothetical protein
MLLATNASGKNCQEALCVFYMNIKAFFSVGFFII